MQSATISVNLMAKVVGGSVFLMVVGGGLMLLVNFCLLVSYNNSQNI